MGSLEKWWKTSFDDIANIFKGVDLEEMLDGDFWFLVLHHNFGREDGNRCSSDDADGGLFLKSGVAWTTWGWFYFLAIVLGLGDF